jgi:Cu2+-containing amine oxidase
MTDLITKNAEERDKMEAAIHNAICIFEQNTGLIVKGVEFKTEVALAVNRKVLSVLHFLFEFNIEVCE